jgi:molecular chaperone DnaK (HSP70)
LQCISTQCKKGSEKQACNVDSIPDSDCDGIPDDWEIKNDLNPSDPSDANLDGDEDSLTNIQEYKYRTNPNIADTDEDKFTDKQEVDAGTDPLNPEDFPKSKTKSIILFVAGFIILVSGIGFLTYRAITKRRSEKFKASHLREISRLPYQPAKQVPISPQKRMEEARIREALKQKEQQKIAERKKLFESFGEREKPRETKEAKKPLEQPKQKIKSQEKKDFKQLKTKPKAIPKKTKEDVFKKLKEIAKESKKKKTRR